MAKRIKVAATCRRCGTLPQEALPGQVDAAAIAVLEAVFEEVQPQKPQLIVLPEMCELPEGWDMAAYVRYIGERSEALPAYIRQKARQLNAWIAYPTARRMPGGKFRNSCLLIDRQGNTAGVYDKMYPTWGELQAGIEAGDAPQVLECELGRVGVAICFDLNYPTLAQEYQRQKVELLLFPSLFHGGLQQKLWAFTTRAYFVGACGGCGASVLSPTGDVLETTSGDITEIVAAINLDFALVHLDFNAEKLAAIAQKYAGAVRIHNPGGLGAVLLLGEGDGCGIKEIAKEFTLETLDEYLQRMALAKNDSQRWGEKDE